MYEDSHINQVSFTPYRHPTEYLRCDIHHVGDMQPQKAHSRTQNTPPTNPHSLSLHPSNPPPHPVKEAYSTARNHPRRLMRAKYIGYLATHACRRRKAIALMF